MSALPPLRVSSFRFVPSGTRETYANLRDEFLAECDRLCDPETDESRPGVSLREINAALRLRRQLMNEIEVLIVNLTAEFSTEVDKVLDRKTGELKAGVPYQHKEALEEWAVEHAAEVGLLRKQFRGLASTVRGPLRG